jgi:putative DNA methylase
VRGDWEARNLVPTETLPEGSKTREPLSYGIRAWADMFSARQLLGFGTLAEERHALRSQILAEEGEEKGEAIVHLLGFVLDKLANWNCILSSWNVNARTVRSLFDRHDFAFKTTFSEMAPVAAGGGLAWAIDNTLSAFEELARLPRVEATQVVDFTQGSATSLIT